MSADGNTTSGWNDVIARITPMQPTDLDAALAEACPRANKPGTVNFPKTAAAAPLVLDLATEETVCFGARITEDTPNRLALAMSLAQMAEEKAATPIILSHVEVCGLERFGAVGSIKRGVVT